MDSHAWITTEAPARYVDRLLNELVGTMALYKSIYYFFLTLGTYDPEGDEKLRKLIHKLGYDHQSVRSVDGKLSCRRTAL